MFPGLVSLKHKKFEVRRGLSTFRTSIVNQQAPKFLKFSLYNRLKLCYTIKSILVRARSSMDRASDSGSECWGFESLRAYQIRQNPSIA